MKKTLWIFGMAIAALTSCTQNEVLEVSESKQIRFEPFVERHTRAVSDLLTSTFTNAWIFGYCVPNADATATPDFSQGIEKVFEEDELSKSNNTWTVTGGKHWNIDHSYRFAGYSDGNNKLGTDVVTYDPSQDKLSFSTYTVAENGGNPKDLVAAIAGDKHSSNGAIPVNLQFRHLLTKVTIYITNASGNADLHLKNVKINNVYKTASCECTYTNVSAEAYPKNVVWTGIGEKESFSLEDVEIAYAQEATHAELTYYLIPQPNSNVTLTLDLEEEINEDVLYSKGEEFSLKTGDTNVRTDYTVNNAWVPGYHYKYTLTRGSTFNKIEFNVSVGIWNADRDGSGTVEGADDIPLN